MSRGGGNGEAGLQMCGTGAAEPTPGGRSRPLVSVVIPCYNSTPYLVEAIESVLGQTYHPLEVIVVDDGSTDDSREVIEGFRDAVRRDYQPHSGVGSARNRGVELSAGSFLAFLDADDVWPGDKLQLQMAAFEADPSLGIVWGHAEQFVSPELPATARARFRFDPNPVPARLPGALMIRREVFQRVGGFSTSFVTGAEIEWCLRASELGVQTLVLEDTVLRRRLHTRNHGVLRRDDRREYVRVLKAALDRRRSASDD